MIGHPVLVRIDYWNPMIRDWAVGHAGINLLDPEAYVHKLFARGTIARAVDLDTGEIAYGPDGDLF